MNEQNREFKFRIWDSLNLRFLTDAFISENGNVYHYNKLTTPYDFHKENNESNFIIQQFIGIKDKNGNDIYEGDVVRINSYRSKYICKILYEGISFKFYILPECNCPIYVPIDANLEIEVISDK